MAYELLKVPGSRPKYEHCLPHMWFLHFLNELEQGTGDERWAKTIDLQWSTCLGSSWGFGHLVSWVLFKYVYVYVHVYVHVYVSVCVSVYVYVQYIHVYMPSFGAVWRENYAESECLDE